MRLHELFAVLFIWQCSILAVNPLFTERETLKDGAEFDYIVVGAGAAGSAVAGRLALAGNHVLLVEAGGDAGLLSKIPRAAMLLQGTNIDWFYETLPNNKSCLALYKRQCRFSRGLCLGGSTSINYMLYVRGNRLDYDYGIPGWSWRDLQTYFLRSEGLRDPVPPSSLPYHNTTGPVKISFFDNSKNPWYQIIFDGLLTLNIPFNPDVNAESQIGVSRALGYVYKGERVNTASAYLEGSRVKRNLVTATHMRCAGVIIDENNMARGVTIGEHKKKQMKVFAKHEVVLSAGTIGSAQILMLSGVGPADHLKYLGITVRTDLPVGENMSDHVLPLMLVAVDRMLKDPISLLGKIGIDAVEWLATHDGPFASIGVTDVMGFLNTNCYNFTSHRLENLSPDCQLPNLQVIFSYVDAYSMNIAPRFVKQVFGEEAADQILAANQHSALLVVSPILLQSKSRGWVRLKSADPWASPAITPNYLDDEWDVKEMVKAIEIVKHLVQTPHFYRYNASILQLKFSSCPEPDAPGYWECYTRHMTYSVYHAVGTAALGTVVDEKLRVRNVQRLRVGDLSVLPRLPRGNTAAAAIAIGERLSDFLLEDKNTLVKNNDKWL